MITDRILPEDRFVCRKSLEVGSRTFYAASFLLPRRIRGPASALYAFCRMADDLIDGSENARAALEEVRERLEGVFCGSLAEFAPDRAFAECARLHAIPKAVLDLMLEGFFWDAQRRRYESLAELRAYAVRVAGTVGVMMAMLMGVRDRDRLARACDLGVAMQLTNVARDVGEDARAGRLYLPLEWLRAEGIEGEQWLKSPKFSVALGRVTRRLLQTAQGLYASADAGIGALPRACRPAIHTARLLYAEIGREVARAGYNSVDGRAVVSGAGKLRALVQASLRRPTTHFDVSLPPMPEADCLMRAARAEGGQAVSVRRSTSRAAWVLELFERLSRMDHASGRAVPFTGEAASSG